MNLSGSVGSRGRNYPSDVKMVKDKLYRLGFRFGTLEYKIKLFQAIIHNFTDLKQVDKKKVDGRIDPGYSTHKWLNSKYPPMWKEIQKTKSINTFGDNKLYTTSWMYNKLKSILDECYRKFKKRITVYSKQGAYRITPDFGKLYIYVPRSYIFYQPLVNRLKSGFNVQIRGNLVMLNGLRDIPRIVEGAPVKPKQDVPDPGVERPSAPTPASSSQQQPTSETRSNTSTGKPKHLTIAEKELGVKEIKGSSHNPRIIEYHSKTGGFTTDEVPWCASFMVWVFKQAGYSTSGLNAAARSFAKSSALSRLDKPYYGSVIVFKYNNNTSWSGHVGIVVDIVNGKYKVLGGNQSDSVKYSYFGKSKVEGFYWPNGVQKTYVIGNRSSSETQETTDFKNTR